ncbi:MAG: sigma-70 family RNA polymerase sigma factor [Chitinophagaceae bacterium]|nr:MAG: sigma-70 family RNA polymerase sigma factor [Chitinophagaceae bacterium]
MLYQKLLYKRYYGFAMAICLRYSATREEAAEILNDGFLKVFRKLPTYDPANSFKGWIRRILVNTAIDNYRKENQHYHTVDIEHAGGETEDNDILGNIGVTEILELVQQLPPSYRLVFNLFVMDGLTHPEISEKLGISEGASKSNLFKARTRLQRMIKIVNPEEYSRYAG